jgi:hypothetical protein
MNGYEKLRALIPEPKAKVKMREAIEMFPPLKLLAMAPQDPVFHAEGDVLTHTEMVANELLEGSPYEAANCDGRLVLFVVA